MSSTELSASSMGSARAHSVRATPRKRRTQAERSDETQQRVIEAAAKVLRKKGYAGLRTEEVSRVAKVSRGAQQYHFPTKDSLVLATAAHLLRRSMERGRTSAETARSVDDPIEGLIQDSINFFLGPEFSVILDLVLASTKDKGLRSEVLDHARDYRLAVEAAWSDVLCEQGLPRPQAEKVVLLTISIVRGFSVRALWQNDKELFRSLLDEWKLILAGHIKTLTGKNKETAR